MTSIRGRPRRPSHEDDSTESYLLTPTQSRSQSSANYLEEDVNPDSDASLLQKHRDVEDDDGDGEDELTNTIGSPNILRRFINFMSQTPLLPGSSQAQETASYGALPAHGPTRAGDIDEEEVDEEEEDDDIRRRDRRKGKSNALRHVDTNESTKSMGPLGSQDGIRSMRSVGTLGSQTGSVSVSRRRTRRSEPAPDNIYASGTGLPVGDGAKLFEGLAPTMSAERLDIEEEGEEEQDEEASRIEEDDSDVDDEDPPDNSPSVHHLFHILFHIHAITGGTSGSPGLQILWCLAVTVADAEFVHAMWNFVLSSFCGHRYSASVQQTSGPLIVLSTFNACRLIYATCT